MTEEDETEWGDPYPGSIDLGDNHWLKIYGWSPDRALNPQYDGIPDEPMSGAIVGHLKPDGRKCMGGITFDTPSHRACMMLLPEPDRSKYLGHVWTVVSRDPLTLAPSLLCKAEGCNDHGFIQNGKWVRA